MAILTVNNVDRTGQIDPVGVLVSAGGSGDSFPNTGYEYVYVKNASGSSVTVTLVYQSTVDGQTITNRTVSVPASAGRLIGPFPTTYYNDSNARMNLTYSSATSVSVAVFKNASS
jgi:hypothetical protein